MMQNNLSGLRKKLVFRSWHRGTREMDLLLGRFAEACLPGFGMEELRLYEDLLLESDPDLYGWISGASALPAGKRNAVTEKLLGYFEKSGLKEQAS